MASITMTASFLAAGSAMTKQPLVVPRRGLVVAKASRAAEGESVRNLEMKNNKEESSSSSGRRDLVVAAAAAAACSIAKVAMAVEPKPGTPEARKKYIAVCVTMPTARICHK